MAVRFQADADLGQVIVAAVLRRSPDIDAVAARNGWKRILARCAPARRTRPRGATDLRR